MRILVPILALIIGSVFVLAMLKPTDQSIKTPATNLQHVQTQDQPASAEAKPDIDQGVSLVDQVKSSVDTLHAPAKEADVAQLPTMHLVAAQKAVVSTLGSLDPESDDKLQVQFTGWGAGLYNVQLTNYRKDLHGEEHYTVQNVIEDHNNPGSYYFPFAARQITVNGQAFKLSDQRWVLDQNRPGKYSIDLADEAGKVLVQLVRVYSLTGNQIACKQQVINHTDVALRIVWNQYGFSEVAADKASYMGDRRNMATGYFDPDYDTKRKYVYADKGFIARTKIVKNYVANLENKATGKPLEPSVYWPAHKAPVNAQMVWTASVNRYFAMAMYTPLVTDAAYDGNDKPKSMLGPDGMFASIRTFIVGTPDTGHNAKDPSTLLLILTTKPITIEPGKTANIDIDLYAGPRLKDILTQQPFASYSLYELIRYELGCTWFTFQWLAHGLLNFLRFLHGIVWDWGISIIILVLCVRALLHPITKKSQINMTKMGKQMQSVQPELKKLKEKYANDQQKYQQEQMKLFREKNINPANMLGCAPMFLQTPIWIALYAMLYFAIELRHVPAFYGVFQTISGGSWQFLADLSAPDNFVQFSGAGFSIPLIFINFHMTGVNILPLLMGVMFFFQQKLTMPPAANEQAAQQQKMMKFMTLLFPFFLYSAPSGLTLYILSSTTAGMIDSYLVRKHINEQEASGELFKVKPRKEGGFMDRISKSMQAKMEQAQHKQSQKPSKNKKRK
ncbi:MAG: YidC/Oxa1 family insertase periplasmic-domain containing protein [Phycisphaeraceae bacterium]|nr:YidC/Oxa1 family insertase periplasmic-domain containing protein [Phycisphaeraceae bacterium]